MSVTYAATLLVVVAVPPQGLRRARRTGNLPLLRLSTLVARVGSGTRHPRGVAARTARSCAGDGRGSVDPSTWREGGRARGVWWREARRGFFGRCRSGFFHEVWFWLRAVSGANRAHRRGDRCMRAQRVRHRLCPRVGSGRFGEEPHLRERVQGSAASP